MTYTSPLGRTAMWRAAPMVSAKTVMRKPSGTVTVSTAEPAALAAGLSADRPASGDRAGLSQASPDTRAKARAGGPTREASELIYTTLQLKSDRLKPTPGRGFPG